MPSQLFKSKVELGVFIIFLSTICHAKDGTLTFNNESFKKGNLFQKIEPFIEICRKHYYKSKHKYLKQNMSYNNLITILRQIAKSHKITYKSSIKYSKSIYNIDYIFYISGAI
jgi:hypothetical protein